MIRSISLGILICTLLTIHSEAADYFGGNAAEAERQMEISGRAAVLDGRSIWFGDRRLTVRLAGIDSCELPQWAFVPNRRSSLNRPMAPVACGALAKAWLKRLVGIDVVRCTVRALNGADGVTGVCKVQNHDLSLEMLRVGLARYSEPRSSDQTYFQAQQHAMAARYGIWAAYVLDMDEWRRRAIDKTLDRTPQADLNLLSTRESEISPPFADARRQQSRRDR